jgi:RNA polymerase sigma factor (sigma-70 family)
MVIRRLRDVLDKAEEATDGQLLERFRTDRDEAAFETLVLRHGPMVFGVCRRVLGNVHDAEDAFQATFLILARKPASVRKRGSLGSFLYGVAHRAALQAKRALLRRRAREASVMPRNESTHDEDTWCGLREALDEELGRLPENYRCPLVLCDLEGRTRREAARQLGLPEGTVASRLARARRLLAKRLARHGLSLSGGAVPAALAEGAASAAVPVRLVVTTVKTATLVAVGQGAGATPAALLMNEVLKVMLLTKLKFVMTAMMVAATLVTSSVVYRAAGQSAPSAPGSEVAKPRTELEALRRENALLKLNLEVVLEKVRAQEAELRAFRSGAQSGSPVEAYYRELLKGQSNVPNLLDELRRSEPAPKPGTPVVPPPKADNHLVPPQAGTPVLPPSDRWEAYYRELLKKHTDTLRLLDEYRRNQPAPKAGTPDLPPHKAEAALHTIQAMKELEAALRALRKTQAEGQQIQNLDVLEKALKYLRDLQQANDPSVAPK